MYIPYGTQSISEEDISAVEEVLRSDFLTTGPKVTEFEQKVAEYVGAKYAVAIANGTAALHAACFAAGVTEGDEVITTPMTFAASANCALYCKATPVFADIHPDTYNISPEEIEKKLTPRTKAVIPVHYTGQPCDMDAIMAIAKKHNLIVIEDAAHALGADYKGKKIGSIADMTTFSFHPVKHITTGEGGMIVTNDEKLYQRLVLFRSHGITRDETLLLHEEGAWYYEQLGLGYNYRITDIQCALGVSQLRRLDDFVARRRELVERYQKAFQNVEGIVTPTLQEGCNSSWHLYVIQVQERRKVFDRLRRAGIGVNVHYIPVYKHPYYQRNGYQMVKCENAEKLYEHIISLPLYPDLTEEQQDYVIEKVIESLSSQTN
jgi:UDP-4-amino-4,6-dideoxy-N-acetyl-beta-L-altrosamine transaminase